MVNTYVILLRGINVGGKNKVAMADLKKCLEDLGFSDVSTYIASGNAILKTDTPADKIKDNIEKALTANFKLDSKIIKILVLSRKQLQAVVNSKPEGFGEQPQKYHSDIVFLMGITPSAAMTVFAPREGVDKVWPGKEVIYSQRLSAERTKSRLSKIVSTLPYQSMTIRTWNTVIKLLSMLKQA